MKIKNKNYLKKTKKSYDYITQAGINFIVLVYTMIRMKLDYIEETLIKIFDTLQFLLNSVSICYLITAFGLVLSYVSSSIPNTDINWSLLDKITDYTQFGGIGIIVICIFLISLLLIINFDYLDDDLISGKKDYDKEILNTFYKQGEIFSHLSYAILMIFCLIIFDFFKSSFEPISFYEYEIIRNLYLPVFIATFAIFIVICLIIDKWFKNKELRLLGENKTKIVEVEVKN